MNIDTEKRVHYNDVKMNPEYREKYFVMRDMKQCDGPGFDGYLCCVCDTEEEAHERCSELHLSGVKSAMVYPAYTDHPEIIVGGFVIGRL